MCNKKLNEIRDKPFQWSIELNFLYDFIFYMFIGKNLALKRTYYLGKLCGR